MGWGPVARDGLGLGPEVFSKGLGPSEARERFYGKWHPVFPAWSQASWGSGIRGLRSDPLGGRLFLRVHQAWWRWEGALGQTARNQSVQTDLRAKALETAPVWDTSWGLLAPLHPAYGHLSQAEPLS